MGNIQTKSWSKKCGLCHRAFTTRYYDLSAVCPDCHVYLIDLDRRYRLKIN